MIEVIARASWAGSANSRFINVISNNSLLVWFEEQQTVFDEIMETIVEIDLILQAETEEY